MKPNTKIKITKEREGKHFYKKGEIATLYKQHGEDWEVRGRMNQVLKISDFKLLSK